MNEEISKSQFGNYDYGLTSEEEVRAAKLHKESIICDMLYWGPCTYRSWTKEMERELHEVWEAHHDPLEIMLLSIFQPQRLAASGQLPEYKEYWDQSGVTAGSRMLEGFASFHDFAFTIGHNIALFDHMPWLIKALHADDIRRAKAEGKHAAWINTQLAWNIGSDFIDLLEPAYALGLRMVQLTYNTMTFIAAGCTERTDAGVSSYGAKVITKMNELGILVDTGHCGRQTTLDACELSTQPVVASHTCAEKVYNHYRGKSDEEIRAIADSGGVIGVVTLPRFLGSGQEVTMDTFLDHMDYIVNLVGWEHAAVGTDWPLPIPNSVLRKIVGSYTEKVGFPKDDTDRTINAIGFDDYRDFPNITRGLVKRGYTDEQIKGILGENFLRVFKTVCG